MASTPPPMTMSMAPDATAWAAKCTACWAEPHWRSTVVPGTVSGNPAARAALRPMFMACSPTVMVQPKITSSTRAGSRSLRATSACRGWAARSTACHPERRPFFFPTGVRTTSTITALAMGPLWPIGHGCRKSGGVSDFPTTPPGVRHRPGRSRDAPDGRIDGPADGPALHRRPGGVPGRGPRLAGGPRPRRRGRSPPSTPPRASRPTGPGRPTWSTTAGRWCRGPRRTAAGASGILEWLIFEEEYWRAQAPLRVSQNGVFLLAPTLFEFGTARADRRGSCRPWPPAGRSGARAGPSPMPAADLAGIRSRARRADADDGWLLTGQKTWASRGAFAEWCFGLFRTDPGRRAPPGAHLLPHRPGHPGGDRAARSPRSTARPASPSCSSRTSSCPTSRCSAAWAGAGTWPWPPPAPSGA